MFSVQNLDRTHLILWADNPENITTDVTRVGIHLSRSVQCWSMQAHHSPCMIWTWVISDASLRGSLWSMCF